MSLWLLLVTASHSPRNGAASTGLVALSDSDLMSLLEDCCDIDGDSNPATAGSSPPSSNALWERDHLILRFTHHSNKEILQNYHIN